MVRKQSIFIEDEKNYVAMPMPDDQLVIAVPVQKKALINPGITYSGQKKALLLHDKNNGLILNRLDSNAQNILKTAKYIHVAEIDYQKKQLKRDYIVPVKCGQIKTDSLK